ncbi:hypothetical protein KBD45_03995 [Candidatus Dojkabacteria bacterium]|nr:hypothetical protein [Candidatus Dojkabacteria bacterium]
MKNKKNMEKGFVTILVLIILSALTLTIILTFFEISFQASRAGLEAELGSKARAYADSCAERALYYFSQNVDIAEILQLGTYEFDGDSNSCVVENIEFEEIDTTTSQYLIKSVGKINDEQVIRRVEIFLKTTDAGESYSYKWTEVDEFNTLSDYAI